MPRRRTVLRGVLLGSAGAALSACTGSPAAEPAADTAASENAARSAPASAGPAGRRVLLAYFSRAGENYLNGGRRRLTVGNTEVVAE
jgi:hypothetical protein